MYPCTPNNVLVINFVFIFCEFQVIPDPTYVQELRSDEDEVQMEESDSSFEEPECMPEV